MSKFLKDICSVIGHDWLFFSYYEGRQDCCRCKAAYRIRKASVNGTRDYWIVREG